jgi:hypothetical protein
MFPALPYPLQYSNYRHSHICGDVIITKINNKNTYDFTFYVQLRDNSSVQTTTKNNEIKYEKLSTWVSKHYSSHTSSPRPSYDCIMELSNNAKFIVTIVNAKVTSKCNLFFYVNSNKTNAIFNVNIDIDNSFKLPLKTKMKNVNFIIFENFNLQNNLNIINAYRNISYNNLNNVKNGQMISITKAGTVLKNSIKLPGSDITTCPEQNITVYKVLYWSSQNEENGPQVVSGSILVPENVSKKEILQTRNVATYQFSDDTILWYSIVNGLDYDKMSIPHKSKILFSGLGYILINADGFGLGASEGKVSANSDFNGEVYPHVDMLRAVRTTLPLFSRMLSNNPEEPLDIIYCGYSNAAIYGPSIVYTLFPGNTQKISSDEASKFNYTRMLLGGCPCLNIDLFKTIQNTPTPTNTLISLEVFGLLSWIIAHSNSGIMMSRPPAYDGIMRPIALGDELQRKNGSLRKQMEILVTSNTLMFPPSKTDVYIPATNTVGDIRQLVNIDNAVLYGLEFTNNHGWTNPKIELANLPKIPITMIYSNGDQIVSPTIGNSQSAIFKTISDPNKPLSVNESAFTYDGAAFLDDYMGPGKVITGAGGTVTFSGAKKTTAVNDLQNDKTLSAVQDIAALIKNTSGNNYLRIKINTKNARNFYFNPSDNSIDFGRASHGTNALTWMESTYYVLQ